jgi:hypothetical protein
VHENYLFAVLRGTLAQSTVEHGISSNTALAHHGSHTATSTHE